MSPSLLNGGKGSKLTRRETAAGKEDVSQIYRRVMEDDVPYDKIEGPNHIMEMREKAIEELAKKGRRLKI